MGNITSKTNNKNAVSTADSAVSTAFSNAEQLLLIFGGDWRLLPIENIPNDLQMTAVIIRNASSSARRPFKLVLFVMINNAGHIENVPIYSFSMNSEPSRLRFKIDEQRNFSVYIYVGEELVCSLICESQNYEVGEHGMFSFCKIYDSSAPEVVPSKESASSLNVLPKRVNASAGGTTSNLFHDEHHKPSSPISDVESRQNFTQCRPTPLKKETRPVQVTVFSDVESRQSFAQCGPAPLKNETGPVQVTVFSGKDATFYIADDMKSITYKTKSGKTGSMSIGIIKDKIKNIEVYELYWGIFLILIHGTDGLVYVSGYTNQRTAKSLTPICMNPCFSDNTKAPFERIEFFPPKTDDDGSELRTLDFKIFFSKLVKTVKINSIGELNIIPN